MGLPVLIYGKSGSGKSRSMKFFGEDEILLLNTERKELPFRKRFKSTGFSDDPDKIIDWAKRCGKKVVVIDDAGYIMTHLFMANHRIKKGNAQFDMYNDIADVMYSIVQRIKKELPVDVIVYLMLHEDMDDSGTTRIRTLGKLLDQKVCMEGMVTICIRCMSDANGQHFFRTVTDGTDITKTPEDMFEEPEIENNLKLVDDTIREFYGWKKKEDKQNDKETQGYDEAPAFTGEFQQLPKGKYVCVIKQVAVKESKNRNNQFVILYDIAEGEQKGFYQKMFDADKAQDSAGAKWRGVFKQNMEGKGLSWFKGVITSIERSNNFTFQWDKANNEDTLKGKRFGGIFRRRQYEKDNGDRPIITELFQIRSVAGLAEAEVPEDSLLPDLPAAPTSQSKSRRHQAV